MGLTEQLIFPEIEYDKIDRTRGMDITFVTTAENNEGAKALLNAHGLPVQEKKTKLNFVYLRRIGLMRKEGF